MQKIKQITEDNLETEFSQSNAIINFGIGSVSTYNLVNCIGIGGIFGFADGTNLGTFLTHESPTDYVELENKLFMIKQILFNKKLIVCQVILFCPNQPAPDIYLNGLTTDIIIKKMWEFSSRLFEIEPIIATYSIDETKMLCGKIIINPSMYNGLLVPMRFDSDCVSLTKNSTYSRLIVPQTYVVEVLKNGLGNKVYMCPKCKNISGTLAPENPSDLYLFQHVYNCVNKDKIPIEKNKI